MEMRQPHQHGRMVSPIGHVQQRQDTGVRSKHESIQYLRIHKNSAEGIAYFKSLTIKHLNHTKTFKDEHDE